MAFLSLELQPLGWGSDQERQSSLTMEWAAAAGSSLAVS